MANSTTRFGLSTFGGDVDGSILDDSGKYTGVDRQLLDLLLAAVEQHNHRFSDADGVGPTDAPTADISTPGSLSAGFDYSYVVSFIDEDGLETAAGEEVTETTPDILVAPDAPSGETDTGGGLANGAYDYALTAVRGEEQSPLGDLFTVTLIDTDATVNLTLPALGAADSLNVWRRKDTEGGFTLIANTVLTSLVDVGAVSAYPCATDPSYAPPSENQGIDQYSFTITLSAADQALIQGYAGWRIYRTTTAGIYSAQSLVAQVTDREDEFDPESDLVVEWIDFGDTLLTGKPTLVDQRMHFQPFTFEESISLAAASGDYPVNYPLVVDENLYISDGAGDWISVGMEGVTGLPPGGTTGQVLAKDSDADGDAEWVDMEAGSGGGGSSVAFRGEWASGTAYIEGDVVQYSDNLYSDILNDTGTTPGSGSGATWTQRTLPSNKAWYSVAYGNGIFAAIGAFSAVAATSPDGITWTQRTLPTSSFWMSITYGGGLFTAVEFGTSIAATSPDGITWTQRTLPTSTNWHSVTYGNGVFVAVAKATSIAATSPDGITWTQRTLPTSTDWRSVTYGAGVFVAVATSASIAATSADGITWTQRTLPTSTTWESVTYGNGLFVAVASGGTIAATSPDGITWTQRVMPASASWWCVTYGNATFAAVATSGTSAATSPDGINWTSRTLPSSGGWRSIAYGDGTFAAAMSDSTIAASSPAPWTLIYDGPAPSVVARTSDLGRNTTTTLTDDPQLTRVLTAGTYLVRAVIGYKGGAVEGLKIGLAYSGTVTSARTSWMGLNAAGTLPANPSVSSVGTGAAIGCTGTGNELCVLIECYLIVSTSGVLSVQWSQNVSGGTDTTLLTGSVLSAQKV